jgi:hypothetical protein
VNRAGTAPQFGDVSTRHQEKSAPLKAGVSGSDGEENATQAAQNAAFATLGTGVVDRFVELLRGHGYYPQALQRVEQGYDALWLQAVKKAVQSLQSELHIPNALRQYNDFCPVGKELLLRELRGKAVRILAHKKRRKQTK